MNKTILLSICIPTYNRAEYLNQTIQSIVNSDGFSDEVEIIISDNCSTDNTENICKQWTDKYQNIKYFKQPKPTSIADQNFIDALSFGTGEYLKLNNDTVFFRKKTTQYMLNVIRDNKKIKNPLFFYNNYKKHINISVICNNSDIFLQEVSFRTMWIPLFGCWKEHFNRLSNKDRFINLQLMQVDWTLRIVSNNKTILNFFELYDLFELKNKNGGYNIFKVFSYNYLIILKEFVEKKYISKQTYQLEKKKLLFNYLIPRYILSVFQQKSYKFNNNRKFVYLKDYKYNWYFYIAFLFIIPYFITYGFVFILRKLTANNPKIYNFLRRIKARIGI
ncbi:MAG: glycosyltransferase family 2 protein [Endomicrobiaceae bacterium]|nr:glycosyltransferase family 2 protein [Endomicrobiaceae bacterium]MDD5101498.1 glycosyltransferase family 2 protein [Endomicrobiaceae bacterium]